MSTAPRIRGSRFLTFIAPIVGLSAGLACVADEVPPSTANEGVEIEILRPLVLTDAARIPETETGFVSVEVMADRVALTVEPSFAAPVAGEVIYGTGGPGYLRRVVSTDHPSDALFIVHTAPAELTDLLADGHFRVTYAPHLPGEADPEVSDVGGATSALTGGGEIEVACGEGNAGLRMFRFGRPEVSLEIEVGLTAGGLAKRVQWDYDDRFYMRFGYEGVANVDCEGEVAFEDVALPNLLVFVGFLPISISQEVTAEASYEFSASGGMEEFRRGVSARPTFEAHYDTNGGHAIEAELRPNGYVTGTSDPDVTAESSLALVTTLAFEAESSLVLGDLLIASVDLSLMSEQSGGECNWTESNRAMDTWTILPGPLLMVGEWETHDDAGLFIGCTDCDSEVRCADDLGRDICLGGEGVKECVPASGGAGFRACRCGPYGFVSCGACEPAGDGGGGSGGGGSGGGGEGVSCGAHEDTGYQSGTSFPITVVTIDDKPVERSTANAYLAMRDAAAAEGVHIRIVSGFRSMAEQEHLYQCYTTCSCNDCNLAARPGYSNHQSGTALDLNRHDPGVLDWLRAHANGFGFYETVPSEPWHWDYQGSDAPAGPC